MSDNRRQHHTPFTADGAVIRDASGVQIAIVNSIDLAAFIVRAANNFDDLLKAAIACKGELVSNLTHPIMRPLLRDLLTIIERLERE